MLFDLDGTHAETPLTRSAAIEETRSISDPFGDSGAPVAGRLVAAGVTLAAVSDLPDLFLPGTTDVTGAPRTPENAAPHRGPPGLDEVERLQHTRLAILSRAVERPSTEDEARYARATARLEQLFPRVTPEDFERLADLGEQMAAAGREADEAWAEFMKGPTGRDELDVP